MRTMKLNIDKIVIMHENQIRRKDRGLNIGSISPLEREKEKCTCFSIEPFTSFFLICTLGIRTKTKLNIV